MAGRRLRAFKKWMTSQGIDCSNALALQLSSSSSVSVSVSVAALCDLHLGDVVATIPKLTCLTVKTSGASHLIEQAELDGCLALAVALMYERSLGPISPWFGYLHLLPHSEPIPLLWSVSEIDELLTGTELHCIVKADKALVCKDWKNYILPLLSLVKPEYFTLDAYFAARSLIASRSFEIDEYHGSGMVPLADLFNHKTGAEDVHITCDIDNESSNESGDDDHDDNVLEMIMVKEVKAGAEVFNTYGLVGNAALLHRYGFAELDNEYDIVNIDMEIVVGWSSAKFSDRYSRRRLSLWRELDYSGCVSQDSEYFEVSFNGEPQVELLVLLYIMLLPEDVYDELDLAASTTGDFEKFKGFKLSKKDVNTVSCGVGLESSDSMWLTEGVCAALLALADIRERLYGSSSLDDDIKALNSCCMVKEPKKYYSLVLRISERRILEKLRCYASAGSMAPTKKGSNARKRVKTV